MAASVDIFILNGSRQVAQSKNLNALFASLAVGLAGSNLVISESTGKFDFNAKNLSNIAGIALASGTVTGLPTTAVSSTDATSKSYVDTQVGLKVAKAGDTMTGNLSFGGSFLPTGLASPTAGSDAVNKSYADALFVGAKIQQDVAAASTGNVDISSAPSALDTVTGVAGHRWLLKDQTDLKENGIYDFASTAAALTRSPSLDNQPLSEIINGVLVPRVKGGTQVGTAWVISSNGTGVGNVHTIGTDNITFTSFATPATYTAGAGIYFSGMQILANVDGSSIDAAGSVANGTATLQIKALGVTTAKLAATSVTAAKLGSDVAGAALTGGNGSALAVNFDNVTLDNTGAGSTLQVKALGVDTAQLAALAVTTAKLAATSVTAAKLGSDVAGSGLTGGNGSALAVSVGTETGVRISGGNVVGDYDRTLTNSSGSSVSAGQVCYLTSSGNIQGLAIAATSNLDTFVLAIADATIAGSGGTGRAVVRLGAIVGGYSGLTPGKLCYVSRSTAGALTQDPSSGTGGFVAGEYVYQVGRAISATEILYNPEAEFQYA